MSSKQKKQDTADDDLLQNANRQGVDKDPGEEKGKKEKVTTKDLKGKKVDADPARESDKPAE
jgi:hypothetical protein